MYKIERHKSHCMGKPTKCLGGNKGVDQLRGNREADQRLCFRYTDSTIPLLLKYKISSLYPSSVTVQAGLYLLLLLNSVLRPFQDYFSSYETGQSVGGAKTGEPREKPHPQAELGLSHMWPERGSNPHQTQR